MALASTVAQPVLAPAYSVIADRENDALVGKLPQKADASLPRPWPIRSWLAFQRRPSRWLSIFALDAISSELTRAMTSAGAISALRLVQPGNTGQ